MTAMLAVLVPAAILLALAVDLAARHRLDHPCTTSAWEPFELLT
jgi:hypothetical protein